MISKVRNNKLQFRSITLLAVLLSLILTTSCYSSRISAPKDIIKVSKILKQNSKKTTINKTYPYEAPVVYKALTNALASVYPGDAIVSYKFDRITKQYNYVSFITTLYTKNPQNTVRGAVVSNEIKRDRKSLILAYVTPNADGTTAETTIEFGQYRRKKANFDEIISNIDRELEKQAK